MSDGGRAEDDEPETHEPWPPAWVASITTDDDNLAANARAVLRTEFGKT